MNTETLVALIQLYLGGSGWNTAPYFNNGFD